MKLIRFGEAGQEKPGVIIENNTILDVSSVVEEFDENFFSNEDNIKVLADWVNLNVHKAELLLENARLGAPVYRPGKIICIGLNYSDHAAESNMELPKEPVVFFKASSAICGPNDDIIIPKGSKKTDWEVELAVVIGKKASYVAEENAMEHVAGYMLHNDYSEREFQLERSGQWVKGKSCDTFAPLGPFLATKNEIGDVHNLRLWLKLNGKTMQDGNTSNLVFKIPYLISYLSQFMSLMPGDIISTGTPAGVGLGQNPPFYLKAGDEVELGIEGLGSAKQRLVAYN